MSERVTGPPTKEASSPDLRNIEWSMMDKKLFFPLSMMSTFSVRCLLYPFTVVKTRLQIQHQTEVYRGMVDAYSKILKKEGVGGLYRGFWVSAFQVVSSVFYITTYENVRQFLRDRQIGSKEFQAMVGGACASVVGQSTIVPFDIISQHVMVLGQGNKDSTGAKSSNGRSNTNSVINPLKVKYEGRTNKEVTREIIHAIRRQDGFRGFYRGYLSSLGTYVPNSALWWAFYHLYQDQMHNIVPSSTSHLLVQCTSATLGGATATLITNPLDIVRARLQVHRIKGVSQAVTTLWAEEKMRMFTKGLSARMFQSVCFSSCIILGYETIKRLSLKEEYRGRVSW